MEAYANASSILVTPKHPVYGISVGGMFAMYIGSDCKRSYADRKAKVSYC